MSDDGKIRSAYPFVIDNILWPGGKPAENFAERVRILLDVHGEETLRSAVRELDEIALAELRALGAVSERKPLERPHLLRVKDQLLDDVQRAKEREKQQKQD